MGNLLSIGEVLIDFIPMQKGLVLKDVTTFERIPGGAPANVAAAVAKFGGNASLITKLGEDAFGDFLLEQLEKSGVNTDKILRTKDANTGLAFVSLQENGERDFSFYRNPSADLLFTDREVNENWFSKGDILHFCSVDLVESPMKEAHIKAIKFAKNQGGIISFDPNVRLPLWSESEKCRNTILKFIPMSHVVKLSDDELEFITGIAKERKAIESLFVGDVKLVILTKGQNGADIYSKNNRYSSLGYPVLAEDTTGAGDAFIGGLLYQLLIHNVDQDNLEDIVNEHYVDILSFANASGALTTTGKGAISSIPTKEQILLLINTSN